MKKLSIAFAGVCAFVFLAPTASAQVLKPKVHTTGPSCKNSSATPQCKDGAKTSDWPGKCKSWTCVHKTKYYTNSACESGYTWSSGKCKSTTYTNITNPKCKIGDWKDVRKSKDKCYSKKNGKGKFKGDISCSGLNSKSLLVDHNTGLEDKCGKKKADKNRKTTKCPAGWIKGNKKTTGKNGYEQYYCNTI
jgi:hypothetical protein